MVATEDASDTQQGWANRKSVRKSRNQKGDSMNDIMSCDSYIRFPADDMQRVYFACIEGMTLIPDVDEVAVIMAKGAREIVLLMTEAVDVESIKSLWVEAFQAHIDLLSSAERRDIALTTDLLRTAEVEEAMAMASGTSRLGRDPE